MGTGKNKCLNSNLSLCMCIHEQNKKQQFVMVDPVFGVKLLILKQNYVKMINAF